MKKKDIKEDTLAMRESKARARLQAKIAGTTARQTLFKSKLVDKDGEVTEYFLMGNGEIKFSSVTGQIFRVAMRPSDIGRIFKHEEGAAKLVSEMLKSDKINNNTKFINSSILGSEYFGHPAIMQLYKDYALNLPSENMAYRMVEWDELLIAKQDEFKLNQAQAKIAQKRMQESLEQAKMSVQTQSSHQEC